MFIKIFIGLCIIMIVVSALSAIIKALLPIVGVLVIVFVFLLLLSSKKKS